MPSYTYQHIKDGEYLDGETDAAYVVAECAVADSGEYKIRVTNTDSGRVKTLGPKIVVVTPAP